MSERLGPAPPLHPLFPSHLGEMSRSVPVTVWKTQLCLCNQTDLGSSLPSIYLLCVQRTSLACFSVARINYNKVCIRRKGTQMLSLEEEGGVSPVAHSDVQGRDCRGLSTAMEGPPTWGSQATDKQPLIWLQTCLIWLSVFFLKNLNL